MNFLYVLSMDASYIQSRMEEIQKNDEISDAFSKIVSGGRGGYKTVIEKKPMVIKCSKCHTNLDAKQKFCHECGTKIEKPLQ